MKDVWNGRIDPFRMFGNLYFVGTKRASSHLIDVGDGLVLLDSGYSQTLYLAMESIWELGFDVRDIKYILHSHGHIDHFGGTRALVELTGAKTFLGKYDHDYVNGKRDLSWCKELGLAFDEPFEPDHLLEDGEKVTLGNTEFTFLHTPGHTEGTMSIFFPVTDGKRTFRAGMHGGVGMNSLSRSFLKSYDLPFSLQTDFIAGLERLRKENVEIHVGNHCGNNDTCGRGKRVLAGEKDAFIDPSSWGNFLNDCEKKIRDLMAKEEAGEQA